jgi:hypothetical protein
MTLRERAKQRYEDMQQEQAQYEAEVRARNLQERFEALRNRLKYVLDLEADPTSDPFEIEGIWFSVRQPPYSYSQHVYDLVIVAPCPRCGSSTSSEPINGLVDLYPLLEQFQPYMNHICERQESATDAPKPEVPPYTTNVHRFVDALVDILLERGVLNE